MKPVRCVCALLFAFAFLATSGAAFAHHGRHGHVRFGVYVGSRFVDMPHIPHVLFAIVAAALAGALWAAIAGFLPEKYGLVALDERGKSIDSAAFAQHLGRFRDAATDVIFVIGGADGLSPELRGKAKLVIAFGAATWPHQMVRVMLLEQIYRAATILAGHPYHRA